ncbi:MAG: hypothetical protein WDZ85_03175 [Candidatus Paceibacterota bacterium]
MAETTYRISRLSASGMIVTALLIDLIALIPIVNLITTATAFMVFGFWFYLKNIPLISTRKMLTYLTAGVLAIIPFLPGITAGVIAVIIFTRTEDKTGLSLSAKPKFKKALTGAK